MQGYTGSLWLSSKLNPLSVLTTSSVSLSKSKAHRIGQKIRTEETRVQVPTVLQTQHVTLDKSFHLLSASALHPGNGAKTSFPHWGVLRTKSTADSEGPTYCGDESYII